MAERDIGEVSSLETAIRADRRRPGRVDYRNPHLVDLLRHAGTDAYTIDAADELGPVEVNVDGLAPARGLLLGCLIGSLAWIAIGLAIWLIF
jgi:hypothetical protein